MEFLADGMFWDGALFVDLSLDGLKMAKNIIILMGFTTSRGKPNE